MNGDSFFGSIRSGFMALPSAIRAFIGLSLAFYSLQILGALIPVGGGSSLNDLLIASLGFDPALPTALVQPWRLFTYMFLHGAPFHLLFNLLWLWWMGRPVEESLGPRTFTVLFLGSGLGGALLDILLAQLVGGRLVIGASGAVYGIMVAFAMLYPRIPIMLFLLPPLEARYVVAGIIALDVLLMGSGDGVARIVHLGGAASGYLLMKAHLNGVDLTSAVRWIEHLWERPIASGTGGRTSRGGGRVEGNTRSSAGGGSRGHRGSGSEGRTGWLGSLRRAGRGGSGIDISDVDILEEKEQEKELDRILEKIARSGYDGLTKEEKKRLFDLSKRN